MNVCVIWIISQQIVNNIFVMEYQINSIEPLMLVGAVVRVLGLDDDISGKQPSIVSKHFGHLLDSIDGTVRDISFGMFDVKAVVQLLLLSSIGYAVLKRRMFTLPDPTILSWWAYNHISGRKT